MKKRADVAEIIGQIKAQFRYASFTVADYIRDQALFQRLAAIDKLPSTLAKPGEDECKCGCGRKVRPGRKWARPSCRQKAWKGYRKSKA
jgi:hypothetical protein